MADNDKIDNGFRQKNKCPYCYHRLDRATFPEDQNKVPVPGDLSICIRCIEVSQWTKNMKLIKFDVGILTIENAREVNLLQHAVYMAQQKKKGNA